MNKKFYYGKEDLTILKVIQIAEGTRRAFYPAKQLTKFIRVRNMFPIVTQNKTVYGINTGFEF
jgi:histidine ammonia-lyase